MKLLPKCPFANCPHIWKNRCASALHLPKPKKFQLQLSKMTDLYHNSSTTFSYFPTFRFFCWFIKLSKEKCCKPQNVNYAPVSSNPFLPNQKAETFLK